MTPMRVRTALFTLLYTLGRAQTQTPWDVTASAQYVNANSGTLPIYLTPANYYQAGSAFMTTPQYADSFHLAVTFNVSDTSVPPADGLTICIQNGGSPSLVGGIGFQLGYLGNCGSTPCIPNSVAVRIDSYNEGVAFCSMSLWWTSATSQGTVLLGNGGTTTSINDPGEVVTQGCVQDNGKDDGALASRRSARQGSFLR